MAGAHCRDKDLFEASFGSLLRSGETGSTLVCARDTVRILFIDDGVRGLPFLRELFAGIADSVESARDETEGLVQGVGADLIVVARSKWADGDTHLCHRLYARRLGIPVLAVSGPTEPDLRAQSLRAGADEFISVPFEVEELIARAYALVRRASSNPRHIRKGVFLLDLGRHQLFVEGRRVALTLRELDLLACLVEKAGEVVTRRDLAERVGSAAARESNIVDVHVSRIRDALGRHAGAIETVRGRGYRFRRR